MLLENYEVNVLFEGEEINLGLMNEQDFILTHYLKGPDYLELTLLNVNENLFDKLKNKLFKLIIKSKVNVYVNFSKCKLISVENEELSILVFTEV